MPIEENTDETKTPGKTRGRFLNKNFSSLMKMTPPRFH